jgi:hypothetical protein
MSAVRQAPTARPTWADRAPEGATDVRLARVFFENRNQGLSVAG